MDEDSGYCKNCSLKLSEIVSHPDVRVELCEMCGTCRVEHTNGSFSMWYVPKVRGSYMSPNLKYCKTCRTPMTKKIETSTMGIYWCHTCGTAHVVDLLPGGNRNWWWVPEGAIVYRDKIEEGK